MILETAVVVGSNPTVGNIFVRIAQLEEHSSSERRVEGSWPSTDARGNMKNTDIQKLQGLLLDFKEHIKRKFKEEEESHTLYWYQILQEEADDILQELGLEQMATIKDLGTLEILVSQKNERR